MRSLRGFRYCRRLRLAWGHRAEPFSIRLRFSPDQGASWGPIVVLRDDGSSRDIGYPRMVQRPDGKVVVVYYMSDPSFGPERIIAASIFDPRSIPDGGE